MSIHESAEDYLESILMLKEAHGMVRSIDIVTKMNYSKPSVSVAMKKLRESGHIQMDEEGYITLTPSGLEIAQRIYGRHKLLSRFLEELGVDEKTAAAEACRIEHDLSEETVRKIRAHLAQMLEQEEKSASALENPSAELYKNPASEV